MNVAEKAGRYRTAEENMRATILIALLLAAIDVTVNNGLMLRTVVAYSNALMWKAGPI